MLKAVIWDKWKYVREIITGIVVDWTQVFSGIKGP